MGGFPSQSVAFPGGGGMNSINPIQQAPPPQQNQPLPSPVSSPPTQGTTNPQGGGTSSNNQGLLPGSLSGSFQDASRVFGQLGQSGLNQLPQANQFTSSMFSPNMTPMAQNYLNSSAALGEQALNNQVNNITGMFANAPYHSALAPAILDATNQFGNQMAQVGSGLGQQQMWTAAGLANQPFQQAFQSATALPQASQQLFNTLQQAQLSSLAPGLGVFGQMPASAPAILQGSSGKK